MVYGGRKDFMGSYLGVGHGVNDFLTVFDFKIMAIDSLRIKKGKFLEEL